MIKQKISFLIGLVLAISAYAGGDSRDVAPVEPLDIIAERQKQQQGSFTKSVKGTNIDTSGAILDIDRASPDTNIKGVSAEPVVQQRVSNIGQPNVQQAVDSTDQPVGHPTGPVKDLAPKIYETCEDMLESDNAFIRNACAIILGTFIVI